MKRTPFVIPQSDIRHSIFVDNRPVPRPVPRQIYEGKSAILVNEQTFRSLVSSVANGISRR